MTQDETLKSGDDLTTAKGESENNNGSTEPSGDNKADQELFDGAKNFQHALQLKQERIKALEAENFKFKKAEEERKLAEMDETEKLSLQLKQSEEKRAMTEIRLIVSEAVRGKNIPTAALDVLKETPWVFPAIKKNLIDPYDVDDTIEAVRNNIDKVVEALEVKEGVTPSQEPQVQRKVDSERSGDSTVIKDRPLTLAEYKAIMAGPDELYIKNRMKVANFIKANGGEVPRE